jgi:hypothetical protein
MKRSKFFRGAGGLRAASGGEQDAGQRRQHKEVGVDVRCDPACAASFLCCCIGSALRTTEILSQGGWTSCRATSSSHHVRVRSCP